MTELVEYKPETTLPASSAGRYPNYLRLAGANPGQKRVAQRPLLCSG
jgi:hypothetical protein